MKVIGLAAPAPSTERASRSAFAAEQAQLARVLAGPRGPRIGAFLDFDGTVVAGFSAAPFLAAYVRDLSADPARLRGLMKAIAASGGARLMSAALRRETRDDDLRAVYQTVLESCAGRGEEEFTDLGERVMSTHLAGRLYGQVWRLIRAHQHMGHTIVLVSSAVRYQMAALARELGIEHVVCTEMEVTAGRFTGRLAGPTLRGDAKARAAVEFATAHGIDLDASYGYADTLDDLAFLRATGRPCAINPTVELARAAAEARWPVLPLGRRRPRLPTLTRSLLVWGGLAPMLGVGAGMSRAAGHREWTAGLDLALVARSVLRVAGVRLRIEGEHHLWAQRPAVFITNHQSVLDAPIAAALVEHGFTCVVKDEFRRVPGLARVTDLLYIDRDSLPDARRLAADALDRLSRGISIIIAPEGTRSLTPAPGPFKKGAFLIAKKAGVPVVPIVIHDSGRLMPRKARTIAAGEVTVTVGEPIDVSAWRLREFDRRIEEVRDAYLAVLAGCG